MTGTSTVDVRDGGSLGPVVRLVAVSKTFPGQRALIEVSMDLYPGRVYGLIGHNGSGKSTLVKILAGYHRPDPGGRVVVSDGAGLAPSARSAPTLAFVHQDLALNDRLTILENFYEGRYWRSRLGRINWKRHRDDAAAWFERFDLHLPLDAPVAALSSPERAMLAVARAARQIMQSDGNGLLVLDEPTPYLSVDGARRLFELVRRVADQGAGVLFVGHDLEEVLGHTDEIFVLRSGRLVSRHQTAEVSIESLVHELVGDTDASPAKASSAAPSQQVCLELQDVTTDGLHDVSLQVRAGEVVGVTGTLGSGFDRLPYAAFGALPATGTLTLCGQERRLGRVTPAWAMRSGMALVPGNRVTQGGMAQRPAGENATMLQLDQFVGRFRRVSQRRAAAAADELLVRHQVEPPSRQLPFAQLSGGNQQKLIVGKWLANDPKVLVMHEPTAGVDIGAKRAILEELRAVARAGVGMLVASTDHDDLVDLCDRVLITRGGRVVSELGPEDLDRRQLLAASMGASAS